eukprot:SAG11_NODE_38081_length_254_cov_0.580645_2_plen_23_part_01
MTVLKGRQCTESDSTGLSSTKGG